MANLKDVAETSEQQIEKISKDVEDFTKRYKTMRKEKNDILMRAMAKDTEKCNKEVPQMAQALEVERFTVNTGLKPKFLE